MRCSHLLALVIVSLMRAEAAESPPAQIAVLTGEPVVQILVETVDWYRAVGAQQQGATQPSDLVILNANAPIADKVINGAFELARADAELLSSEVESADGSLSPRAI